MSSADQPSTAPEAEDEFAAQPGPPAYVFSDDDDETGLTPAHPAATVVIFHESDRAGPPPLLLVRRSQNMAFAAGAAVFPGGRVDADDHDLARQLGDADSDPLDLAARIAAVRETLEETGLGLGFRLDGRVDAVQSIREGLLTGQPLSALLSRHDVALDVSGLVPFARWRPNFNHARVFDTRFYLARVSGDVSALSVDHGENSELFWATAAHVLDRADQGELDVIFPTRRNLERIAQFSSFDAAAAAARATAVRRITPWVESRDGAKHLCIRNDCGYPITSESIAGALRG